MENVLFWLYLGNTLMLIVHEIDSAYWQEWKLFHLPGGVTVFLLLHIPLLAPVLYGPVLIDRGVPIGLFLSLLVSIFGLFAFAIHTFFIRRGHPEFRTPVSLGILWTILLVSIVQFSMTLSLIVRRFNYQVQL
jgi:hypothetical protein